MTDKTTEALKLAEALENDAKEHREVSYGLDCPPERTANWKHALNCEAAARLIREALAEQEKQEPVAWPVDRNWFYSVLRYAEKNPDCFDEVAPDCVSLDSCDADTVIDALNAAPVSTEAIRAEALEQAEEIAKTIGGSFSVEFLAAIRELK